MNNKKGFTLVELMLVAGIVVILATIGTLSLLHVRDVQELENGTRALVVHLRDAQQRSLTQEEGGEWGIFFTDSAQGDFYDLATSSSRVIEHVALDASLEFDNNPPPPDAVRFKRISGESVDAAGVMQNGTITIRIKQKGADCGIDPASCKTIEVKANGVIQRL